MKETFSRATPGKQGFLLYRDTIMYCFNEHQEITNLMPVKAS